MQLSDIEPLLRSRLTDGETMFEEPSDYYDDRMYTIVTSGAVAHAYTLSKSDLYGIGTLDVLEVWRPGEQVAGRAIDAILDYARRNGQPAPPPDPNEVFADAITFLRPLLQEGEALTAALRRDKDPALQISGAAGTSSVWQSGDYWCFTSAAEQNYIRTAETKEERRALLLAALDEARNPIDPISHYPGSM